MSLSEQQIKNAQKIFDNGLVQKVDETHWIVQGSKERLYYVDTESGVFTCWTDPKERKLCKGWQFCTGKIKECKHVEAVRISVSEEKEPAYVKTS